MPAPIQEPPPAPLDDHCSKLPDIEAGEFTYSKLIIRDKNGIGKNPLIKELKYVPVCDKSIKKRKASQLAKEEQWQRL